MKPEDVKFALSVSHCPWIGGRAKSMENLRHALGIEGESCVGADAYHEERERAPWWLWSESMWRWAASQDHTTHAVLLQDDAIATPHAWPILSAMVAARPTDVISLHCLHPAAMTLCREGVRWASTCDGLVGLGYVFPRQALVDFLAWRPKNLRPGGAQELAEDSHINIWAISTGRRILHPLPTVLDHDTSVGSTNQAQTCGSPRVLWSDGDVGGWAPEDLERVEFWTGKAQHLGRMYEKTHWAAKMVVPSFDRFFEVESDECPQEYSRFFRAE